jgi:ABC-type lipoprotein release transport system permease subunit
VISDWRGVLVSTPVVTSVDVVSLAFGIGALAGWVPAWRTSRIDPAEVLRES